MLTTMHAPVHTALEGHAASVTMAEPAVSANASIEAIA